MKNSSRSNNTFIDSYLVFVDQNNKIPQTLNGIGFFDHEWFVKIVNNYGCYRYLSVSDNLDCVQTLIQTKQDIFNHIKLPQPEENADGSRYVCWEIADKNRLYLLDVLPQEYYAKEVNPKSFCCLDCFEKEEVPDVFAYADDYYKNSTVYHERKMEVPKSEAKLPDGGNFSEFLSQLM